MNIKHFFEVYSPKRLWRKMWLCFASLPMLPQHRAKLLKLGGGEYKRSSSDLWWGSV